MFFLLYLARSFTWLLIKILDKKSKIIFFPIGTNKNRTFFTTKEAENVKIYFGWTVPKHDHLKLSTMMLSSQQ